MTTPTLATVWLDGCSGCHMSLLDTDERLLELLTRANLVYSPLVDTKEFPEHVDVTLVEGAVSSEEDLEKIRRVRAHTTTLVSLGDCAVTANVPSLRNLLRPSGAQAILRRAYLEHVDYRPQIPAEIVPRLLQRVRPVHEVVLVDVFVPGCPPSADTIYYMITELLEGRTPELGSRTRFGA